MKMKKINYLILFLLLLSPVFMACERDMESEGISRVTNFPTFNMAGDQYMSIVVGGTYTEEGVTATENGASLPVTTTGSVDTSKPGFYDITYSATNSDGFPASITRTIAIIPVAEAPVVDLSGTYKNVGAANLTAKITKLAPAFYMTTNVWGGGSLAVIPAYFISTNGTSISLPVSTLSPYGRVSGSGTYTAGLIEWTIALPDAGAAPTLKKWQKQ
jgi:hypothetical protein